MIERLLKLLPHKDILKHGLCYLRRHYLSPRTWNKRIFLHLINKPDDDRHHHNHPWPFWTVILRGHYIEEILNPETGELTSRGVKAGDILYRPDTHTHKIIALIGDKPAWTLVFAGRATRKWGFWVPVSSLGKIIRHHHVPWDHYLVGDDGLPPPQLPEDVIR